MFSPSGGRCTIFESTILAYSRGQKLQRTTILPANIRLDSCQTIMSAWKLDSMQIQKTNLTSQILVVAIVACIITLTGSLLAAESDNTEFFGVRTQVFEGEGKAPVLETETVFIGARVYDAIVSRSQVPQVITKFDLDARFVQLVDREKKVRTSLKFKELSNFQAGVCARALQQKDGLTVFLAEPKFASVFDPGGGTISLKSKWMTYVAEGKQGSPDVVGRFVEFADWSSRLSTILHYGHPASARIALNRKLKELNWQVVRLTRQGGSAAPSLGVVHSQHAYRYELSEDDENFIEGCEKDLKAFREVSFSEFHKLRNSSRLTAK